MSDKIKFSFDFTQNAVNFFEDLHKRSGLKNRSSVLVRALRLYDFFLSNKKAGYKFAIVKDGVTQEVDNRDWDDVSSE